MSGVEPKLGTSSRVLGEQSCEEHASDAGAKHGLGDLRCVRACARGRRGRAARAAAASAGRRGHACRTRARRHGRGRRAAGRSRRGRRRPALGRCGVLLDADRARVDDEDHALRLAVRAAAIRDCVSLCTRQGHKAGAQGSTHKMYTGSVLFTGTLTTAPAFCRAECSAPSLGWHAVAVSVPAASITLCSMFSL